MPKEPISIQSASNGYRVTIHVDWDEQSFSYRVDESDFNRKRLIHLDVDQSDVEKFIAEWKAILLRLEDDLATANLIKKLVNPVKEEILKDPNFQSCKCEPNE